MGGTKEDCCGMFRALSVRTRFRILEILKAKGPLGAKGIAALIGVTPAAVSQHLRVLREAGLVSSERKGYFIPYRVDPLGLRKCGHTIVAVCECEPSGEREASVRRSGRWLAKLPGGSDLESLERYRRELERELDEVKKRLERARGGGRR